MAPQPCADRSSQPPPGIIMTCMNRALTTKNLWLWGVVNRKVPGHHHGGASTASRWEGCTVQNIRESARCRRSWLLPRAIARSLRFAAFCLDNNWESCCHACPPALWAVQAGATQSSSLLTPRLPMVGDGGSKGGETQQRNTSGVHRHNKEWDLRDIKEDENRQEKEADLGKKQLLWDTSELI